MKSRLVIGRYRHYKGGYYRTHGIGIVEATNEACVIYYHEEDTMPVKTLWVRTLENWNETVNGVPRFTLVDEPNESGLSTEP